MTADFTVLYGGELARDVAMRLVEGINMWSWHDMPLLVECELLMSPFCFINGFVLTGCIIVQRVRQNQYH